MEGSKRKSQRREDEISKTVTMKRKYISIDEVQQEYLSMSKKKIRCLVRKHLDAKVIGSRIFVCRDELEALLSNPEISIISLD